MPEAPEGRLLWLSIEPPWPPTSGGRLRTVALLRGAARRFDVTLAVLFGSTPSDRGPLSDVGWLEAGGGRAGKMVAMASLMARRHPPYLRHFSTPAQRRTMAAVVAGGGFDLVVADMPYAVEVLPKDLPAPLLVNTQNVEADVWKAALARTSGGRVLLALDRRMMARWERTVLARANAAVFCSELDEAALRPSLGDACLSAVVPNAVDTEAIRPLPAPASHDAVLFVGGLGYGPNREAAEFIVRDLAPAAANLGVTALVLGGDLEDIGGRGEGVEFLGRPSEVGPAYERAFAVVVPLFSGSGTRLKVLEAFAYGRPVVATAKAVEGLDAIDGVHYLRAETAAGFRDRLAVLRDPAASRSIVVAARSLVESRYSSEAAGSEFAAFAARVLAHVG